jgi:hypothetical protein
MKGMSDDQLRALLSRRDPAAGRPAGDARDLWEQIMTTPVDDRPATAPTPRPRRRLTFALAAAALAAVAGVGTAVTVASRDTPDRSAQTAAVQPMQLRMPDSTAVSSCAIFDVAFLAQAPVAFQGKAVEVKDTSVVLTVDRWFRGGPDGVTQVRVSRPGPNVSEGVEFTAGKTYLVSALEGDVTVCGYTGELTPELLAAYNKAFGTK